MPQRNIHRSSADYDRLVTIDGLPRTRGMLVATLVLDLLITTGGAG